jgi:hypothetical protein
VQETDAEILTKRDGIFGEGSSLSVEHEGENAVGLKRGTKENMFRVI